MLEYGVKACDMNLFYCYKLALIYEDGVNGVPKDMAKAMEYYKMRCNSEYEDLEICQKIGDAYAKGDGVPKDYKIASEYYKKACKHDQYGGVCIDSNIISAAAEVNADAITIEALIKSCDEKKNSVICGYVGGIYQVGSEAYDNKLIVGKPTPQNMDKCIEYYTKACNLDKNNGTSCYYAKVFLEAKQAKEANASTEQSDRNTSGGSR
jgi:TPR repeat protein